MNNSQRRRRAVWLLIAISACVPLLCCGVLAGLIDHFMLFHYCTYEQSTPAQVDGVSVEVSVLPEKRIKTGMSGSGGKTTTIIDLTVRWEV